MKYIVHYEVPENPPRWSTWVAASLDKANELKDIVQAQGMKAYVQAQLDKT
jgi:hypothetical protein